jgi:hypothetical protein
MLKKISLILLMILFGISSSQVYSEEMSLSTFQETAQVIIDKKISKKTIASITLLSSNIQEILIPNELEEKIRNNERIQAIILTNQDKCVLGVNGQSCIIINVERNPEDKGINAIQDSTREIGDQYINEINNLFDTNAEFYQVYIHTSDETNQELDTSGIISGSGIISAVYTMPMEDTYSMYEKISSMLISKSIRDGGGFYNIGKNISTSENAKMTFSIIPSEKKSLFQLRVSTDYPVENESKINPLKFLKTDNLKRSSYFSSGNYPLNSIFQIVILSNETTEISEIKGNIIPSQLIDGIKIPTEITKEGWIFDPQQGEQIQAKYLFGQSITVNQNDLKFSIINKEIQLNEQKLGDNELDESTIIVVIIVIVSIGAATFYLKGYKK